MICCPLSITKMLWKIYTNVTIESNEKIAKDISILNISNNRVANQLKSFFEHSESSSSDLSKLKTFADLNDKNLVKKFCPGSVKLSNNSNLRLGGKIVFQAMNRSAIKKVKVYDNYEISNSCGRRTFTFGNPF